MKTFEELLAALSQRKINYILVGGLAVDLCGFSRATSDVDILIERTPANLTLLLEVLRNFGEGSAKELSQEDFSIEEGCIRIVEDFPLDVFTLMGGRTYHDMLPFTKVFHTSEGVPITYLNKEGLIMLKSKSHRPKDQIDVVELKKLLSK
jgi:Nucleotidyltransferase of unknown function (DUF6036)